MILVFWQISGNILNAEIQKQRDKIFLQQRQTIPVIRLQNVKLNNTMRTCDEKTFAQLIQIRKNSRTERTGKEDLSGRGKSSADKEGIRCRCGTTGRISPKTGSDQQKH